MLITKREALALSAGALLATTGWAQNSAKAQQGKKTLRMAPHAPLRVLDPVATNAYITRNHGYMVYDTLFSVDAQYRPQPQMVKDWQVSPDGLAYTFTLRDGLAFHDGQPVTAEDCIASIARWAKKDVVGMRLAAVTSSMEAVDGKTFRIALKEPFGPIIEAFAR